ncbi:hypothetical protein SAMN06298216_3271 [Spirosomataceae bacterium TFI 002]|nr:hypothetical protein SAMN06298216_3271 [Spirosomataceae bacterium TFI 002]
MSKTLKILGIVLVVLLIAVVATCSYISKPLPEATSGVQAEELADKMWNSLNKPAWDSTRYVSWSFRGEHHYKWDKEANLAEITWDDYLVLLNPDQVNGVAYEKGVKVEDPSKLIDKAWGFWCNDMFWLTAPFKIRDKGTKLSLTNDNNLMVQYESGGVTPGDAYIWILDENGIPMSYDMHVSIIPVKGLNATWETWENISSGAKLSTMHIIAGSALSLAPIAGGMELKDIGIDKDIWAEIRQ